MKASDLRNKPTEELEEDVENSRQELFNLRFQSSMEQVESPARIRQLRRTIATIKTLLRERELGIRGATAPTNK